MDYVAVATIVLYAAAVFSTYVSLGGIWGTAVTNVIHTVVILVSLLGVGVLGIQKWADGTR